MPDKQTRATALYLSYDGMCDPLGGSQVLPYVVGLARLGHRLDLISFEKPEVPAINAIREELRAFAMSILNDSEPLVSITDAAAALEAAHRVLAQLELQKARTPAY